MRLGDLKNERAIFQVAHPCYKRTWMGVQWLVSVVTLKLSYIFIAICEQQYIES